MTTDALEFLIEFPFKAAPVSRQCETDLAAGGAGRHPEAGDVRYPLATPELEGQGSSDFGTELFGSLPEANEICRRSRLCIAGVADTWEGDAQRGSQ